MLDKKLLRENPEWAEEKLQSKESTFSIKPLLELDAEVRHLKGEVETLKSERNLLSKQIGEKKRAGEDASNLMNQVSGLGEKISELDTQLHEKNERLEGLVAILPNIPMDHVKVANSAEDNVLLRENGSIPQFSFSIKNHVEIGETLNLFDFKRGAKVGGSNWPAYRGMGARLEWALLNYMLDIHIENGFTMWIPPLLVRPEIAFASAHLPKFADQLFKIDDEDYHLYLIPTSETALNGLHCDEILEEAELPKKYVAFTPCFRREAGAHGAGERGLIRTHQFHKVEMFAFSHPEQSGAIFDEMVQSAETILKGLELPYRVMELVTSDMSFAAARTIDLEVWLPGQERFYEVSSVSHCTDFQARRSHIRYKSKEEKPHFVHTLNGSGLATSRLMVGLLENNQREDGSVALPLVLHKYLGGIKELRP